MHDHSQPSQSTTHHSGVVKSEIGQSIYWPPERLRRVIMTRDFCGRWQEAPIGNANHSTARVPVGLAKCSQLGQIGYMSNACLFGQLSSGSFYWSLARFHNASRKRPHALVRRVTSLNQKDLQAMFSQGEQNNIGSNGCVVILPDHAASLLDNWDYQMVI